VNLYNFQQIGESDFSLFRGFPAEPVAIRRNKGPAAYSSHTTDPVASRPTGLAYARTWRQMGILNHSGAMRRARTCVGA
jgi:hypothetical protein